MPVYLCQPGATASEPWRHGIQVYAAPFSMDEVFLPAIADANSSTNELPQQGPGANNSSSLRQGNNAEQPDASAQPVQGTSTISRTGAGSGNQIPNTNSGLPIRRVRHAEVVLVDDVCVAFDRYWLRLRWPGLKGGFAGYIALGKVNQEPSWLKNEVIPSTSPLGTYII
jgi:hypothetical protein